MTRCPPWCTADHPAEDEPGAVWVYLGDGWTGFSLSMESAARLSAALADTLRAAGTLEGSGL